MVGGGGREGGKEMCNCYLKARTNLLSEGWVDVCTRHLKTSLLSWGRGGEGGGGEMYNRHLTVRDSLLSEGWGWWGGGGRNV